MLEKAKPDGIWEKVHCRDTAPAGIWQDTRKNPLGKHVFFSPLLSCTVGDFCTWNVRWLDRRMSILVHGGSRKAIWTLVSRPRHGFRDNCVSPSIPHYWEDLESYVLVSGRPFHTHIVTLGPLSVQLSIPLSLEISSKVSKPIWLHSSIRCLPQSPHVVLMDTIFDESWFPHPHPFLQYFSHVISPQFAPLPAPTCPNHLHVPWARCCGFGGTSGFCSWFI